MVRIRRKVKKKIKIILIVSIILVVVAASVGGVCYYLNYKEKVKRNNEEKILKEINSHYGEIVEVSKDTTLYEVVDGKYKKVGTISKGERVALDDIKIELDTKYFKITELGYYIKYQDVEVSDSLYQKNERYKKYIVFNENVVTKDGVRLFRDGKLIYTLDKGIEEEIIFKEDNGFYIEHFNELFFVSSEDVLSVNPANNTTLEEASGIPVTVYHFIYLNGDTSCNESICHSENQIREHFNYLNTNGFFTMTTTELRYYLEGKLRVPKKSILITIDDGARAWNFIPILEECKINATLFLISGWYGLDRFQSPYLEVASHTHNLHTPGVCAGGQGSPLKCLDKTQLVADLKLSREVLGGTEAFCYPFYEYNDYSISALKEAGFKMGFIGGYRKATRGVDLYKIPRIPLTDYTTLDQYARYIN